MDNSQGKLSCCKTLDANHAKWVNLVLDNVKYKIEHILQIWNDVGFDEKRIETRIKILQKELGTCLQSLISEEERKVACLQKDVKNLKTEIINLSADLGMKVEPMDSSLSLLDIQKLLSESRETLSETISSRMERFKTLSSENQRICEKLGEQPKRFSFKNVPSPELLESMNDEINVLLQQLSRKNDIESGDSDGKKETTSPESDSANLDTLMISIKDTLIELHKLYDECLVDSSVRDNFPLDCPLKSPTTTHLEEIKLEIACWKEYRTQFVEAISAYKSWRKSFTRLSEIENLIKQGRGSDRLEKEATSLREKILPDLEKILELASRRSNKFTIYGQPPIGYVQLIRRSQARESSPLKTLSKPAVSNTATKRPDIEKKEQTSSLKTPRTVSKPTRSFRRTKSKSDISELNQNKAPSSISSVQSEPIMPKTPIPKWTASKLDPKILALWTGNKCGVSSTPSQHEAPPTSVKNKTASATPKFRPPLSRMLGKKNITASPTERSRGCETRSAIQTRISKSFDQFKVPRPKKLDAISSVNSQKSSEQSILDLWYKKKDTSNTSQCGSPTSVRSEMAPTSLKNRAPLSRMFGKEKNTASSVERPPNGTTFARQRRVLKSSKQINEPQHRDSSTASYVNSRTSYERSILDLWYKKDTSNTSQLGSLTSVKDGVAPTAPSSYKKLGKENNAASSVERPPNGTTFARQRRVLKVSKQINEPQPREPCTASSVDSRTSYERSILDLWYKKDTSDTSHFGSPTSVKDGVAPTAPSSSRKVVKPPKTTVGCTASATLRTPRPLPSSRRALTRNRNLPETLKRLEEVPRPVPVIELFNCSSSKNTSLSK